MMELRIRVFESLEEAESIWRSLECSGSCYVFQTYDWVWLWHQTVGMHRHFAPCPVVIDGPREQPLMLLPLAVRGQGMLRTLTWLGDELADYLGPLLADDFGRRSDDLDLSVIWPEVLDRLPQHDLMLLERQPAIIGDESNPMSRLRHQPHAARAHYTALGDSLDGFLKSRRSNRSLSNDRRKHKRLNDRGTLKFVVVDTDKLTRFLPEMMAQKSRSYREMGVTDLFAAPEHRNFIEQLSIRCPQLVVFFALTLDDETLSTLWGLSHTGRFYHLFPTYERNEYSDYGPGNILLRHVFEWCIDNGIRVYDFTVGDEQYKSHWCDRDIDLFDTIRATSLRGWLPALALRIARRAKRKIKASPRLYALATRLRARRRARVQ